ncbi:MAG: WGR domain-containing protein [Gammaproteobacteria bacterium]|jgi:predicted DNA-binding WGR domain protein
MRVYMQMIEDPDKAPRFYLLMLQEDLIDGWTLVREWGQQGSPGRVKKDHFDSRDDAEHALLKVRDAQLKRGYRVVYMRGAELT